MATWYSPSQQIPADGTKVWVRPIYWWYAPFLATINYSTVSFTADATNVPYPVWSIARWRYQ